MKLTRKIALLLFVSAITLGSRCLLTNFRHLLLPFLIKFYIQNVKAFRFGFSVHSLRLRIISLCLDRLVFADFHTPGGGSTRMT